MFSVAQLHQIALGLAYLHAEGVVHGDLHAGNILVDGNGALRLGDFGMSLIAEGTGYNYGSLHGGGATRWSAPELFEPEEFGLESSRPTFKSDIYAFACICIEVWILLSYFCLNLSLVKQLYTGKPPFPDLMDRQVPRRVVRGDRPPRPSVLNGDAMPGDMWSLTQSCWSHDVTRRPSADTVVSTLAEVRLESMIRQYWVSLESVVQDKMHEIGEVSAGVLLVTSNCFIDVLCRAIMQTCCRNRGCAQSIFT